MDAGTELGQSGGERYRVGARLGQGGMGAVWEATRLSDSAPFAIKTIHEEVLGKGEHVVRRFNREARAAAALQSPHIATVVDAGFDDASGVHFMVMEKLEGEDVKAALNRVKTFSIDTSLRVISQACRGLRVAHEAGIVHRDIKPSNLFLANVGSNEIRVKVLDFGVAKIQSDQADIEVSSTGLTKTGAMLGSPLYMSPEQARGLTTIDGRADLWSLGILLFRMLTGKTPHEHIDAIGELILSICADPVRPPSADNELVPTAVDELTQGLLEIDLKRRFANASDVTAVLDILLDKSDAIDATMIGSPKPDSERMSADAISDRASTIPSILPSAAPASVEAPNLVTPPVAANGTGSPVLEDPPVDVVASSPSASPPAKGPPAWVWVVVVLAAIAVGVAASQLL